MSDVIHKNKAGDRRLRKPVIGPPYASPKKYGLQVEERLENGEWNICTAEVQGGGLQCIPYPRLPRHAKDLEQRLRAWVDEQP